VGRGEAVAGIDNVYLSIGATASPLQHSSQRDDFDVARAPAASSRNGDCCDVACAPTASSRNNDCRCDLRPHGIRRDTVIIDVAAAQCLAEERTLLALQRDFNGFNRWRTDFTDG
jgi:hypothetical protein